MNLSSKSSNGLQTTLYRSRTRAHSGRATKALGECFVKTWSLLFILFSLGWFYQTAHAQIPTDTGRNHYKTWRVQPEPFSAIVNVQDQFMTDSLRLSEIDFLSNPVLKVHQADTFNIQKPDNHLTWYRAEGKPTTLTVNYANQFETTAVAIDSVVYLLVPTQKEPHAPPESLDHYKAYRIAGDPNGFINPIMLEDQFDVLYGLPEAIDSLIPRYFLTPAVKNAELTMLFDSVTHYVAYEIFPMRFFPAPIPINTFDQFGPHPLQVIFSQYLLVPTRKLSYGPPPSDTGKNHYKTWRVQPEPFSALVNVQDQFMTDSLRLTGVDFLSNPVLKVHQADTFNIRKPNDHLTWYRAEGKPTTLTVNYANQFETTAVAIDSVVYLLVPTQKEPHAPPESLDHYKAYRIAGDPNGFINPIMLEDQFDVLYGLPEAIDSLVPRYFLTPAVKNAELTMLFDSVTHYVAYEIFPMRFFPAPIPINTFDQFGPHPLQVIFSQYLLVPTGKLSYSPPPDTLGSIGGIKFEDLDGDGIQGPGESGLSGWTINLAGPVPGSTVTGVGGAYSFSSLPAGNYTLSEVLQAGWTQTAPPPPGTHVVALLAGQDIVGKDFGNDSSGSICGSKFNDLNCNGLWDGGEPGLAGWTINLTGPVPGSVVTGAGGTYCFNGLSPGVYTVSEVLQPGWTQSMPPPPGTYTVPLQSRQTATGIDFGNCPPPLFDTSKNHYKTWRVQPEPFSAIVNVQDQFMTDSLRLTGVDFLSNPVLKVHQADTFNIQKPDNHLTWYRAEGRPTTLTVNYANQFETTAVAIDSVVYLLVPTQKEPHAPPESLDHYKAYRIAGDLQGLKSPIPVLLEDQFDVLYGLPEAIDSLVARYFLTPAVKNMELTMLFDSVTHYVAYEIFPPRSFQMPINTFDQFGPHPLQVIFSQYLLVPTGKLSYSPPPDTLGSIGGIKFEDLDGDGIQGPGESGLSGWTINLAGPVPGSTLTGVGGAYSFSSLPAGNYTLSEVLQAGWTQTAPPSPGTYMVDLLAGQDLVGYDFANQRIPHDCPTWVTIFDLRAERMGFKIPTEAKLMTRNLAVLDTGDIYVCGYSDGYGTKMDYVTINYDESGAQLWATRYDNGIKGDDKAYALVVDAARNVYVTGESKGTKTNMDVTTVQYNSAGVQQWVARWNNTVVNGRDAGYAIALNDSETIVYVTGETKNKPGRIDYVTIAYNAATGAQLWVQTYDGPSSKTDKAYAIAVDAGGDVIVTGESDGFGTKADYATIKYNGATGAQLWVNRYNAISKKDYAFAIATDPASNVYVTGASEGSAKFDYATIKYDAAGSQLWLTRYDAGGQNDLGYDLALDDSGDVYVTGASKVKLTNLDYATIKYDGLSGAQIWVNRYDGGIRKKDIGRSVTVCNEEDKVFVTGSSDQGTGRKRDYSTVKIDAAAGTTDWVGRYNGAIGKDDIAYNVRLRPYDCCVILTGTRTGVKLDFATIQGASGGPVPAAITTPAIPDGDEDGPATLIIQENYPNPFNPTTTIQFTLPQEAHVTLTVYDMLGREITTMLDRELMEDGEQEVEFDASNLASGVYYYRIDVETIGNEEEGTTGQTLTSVRKMLLIR